MGFVTAEGSRTWEAEAPGVTSVDEPDIARRLL